MRADIKDPIFRRGNAFIMVQFALGSSRPVTVMPAPPSKASSGDATALGHNSRLKRLLSKTIQFATDKEMALPYQFVRATNVR